MNTKPLEHRPNTKIEKWMNNNRQRLEDRFKWNSTTMNQKIKYKMIIDTCTPHTAYNDAKLAIVNESVFGSLTIYRADAIEQTTEFA